MVTILNETPSIAGRYLTELRSTVIQQDSLRFRTNLNRLGTIMAYEVSKALTYQHAEVETPLGIAKEYLSGENLVLGTILRAGLPMHQGMLAVFDRAENAFVSAYRKHHKDGSFDISLEYVSCPNLEDKVLIVCDAMIATGASMKLVLNELSRNGQPSKIHIVGAIASSQGLELLKRRFPQADIWLGAVDEELTAKAYIVPGLGDAGDLAFGSKMQE